MPLRSRRASAFQRPHVAELFRAIEANQLRLLELLHERVGFLLGEAQLFGEHVAEGHFPRAVVEVHLIAELVGEELRGSGEIVHRQFPRAALPNAMFITMDLPEHAGPSNPPAFTAFVMQVTASFPRILSFAMITLPALPFVSIATVMWT